MTSNTDAVLLRYIPAGCYRIRVQALTQHLPDRQAWTIVTTNGARIQVNAYFDTREQIWWFYYSSETNRIGYWPS